MMRAVYVCYSLAIAWALVAFAPAVVAAEGEAGAATSTTEKSPSAEKASADKSTARDQFSHGNWPFRPLTKPSIPKVVDSAWVKNPVDAFVLHELEKLGLRASPPADKLALLRRVTFDLTGLPPTLAEQQAFLNDSSDDAFARVIDRLLDSPHYGERFAQHWLDLVRFAESDGFNQDAVREQAYHYRDYCIQAFNEDLPYNRFVAQQLAGDELEPNNPKALVATGLNRLYPDEWNAGDLRLRRQEILDDVTDTTGLVFMGLTMGCAQCHDHKFDEILQADYFRLQAFFAPMLARDDLVLASPEERQRHEASLKKWEAATKELRDQIDSILEPKRQSILLSTIKKYDVEIQAAITTPDSERTAYQKHLNRQASLYYGPKLDEAGKSLKGAEKERLEKLQAELAKFDHLKPQPLPRAMAISDASSVAPVTYRLATGNVRKRLEVVEPGFPVFLGGDKIDVDSPANRDTTGRRSALVQWLTRSDHPLTTRVMVNRIWQYHFGEGIVSTANDFGAMGASPANPNLLDWLSVQFVENGWSFKKLHRLLLTSNAYQQASVIDDNSETVQAGRKADVLNRTLWHAHRRRLEGEAIRDAMLLVSGELDPRLFGPSIKPDIPAGASNLAWKADPAGVNQNRRSIYVLAKRNFRYPMFDAFDAPDMHHSCAKRPSTTTAPQALVLLNSEFTFERARHWAGRLLDQQSELPALVKQAYREAMCRDAESAEVAAAVKFITVLQGQLAEQKLLDQDRSQPPKLSAQVAPARAAAVVEFCHALFNSNEFVYVD